MNKPKFDPNKPFEVVADTSKPKFDPTKPYEVVNDQGRQPASIYTTEKYPTVINEMHPDLTFKDRLVVKNLATDQPGVAVDYLQRQHPNMDFKDYNGEVLAKNKNETAWKKLDPSGFDIQDITDVGSDIAGGLVTTAGTALGALAGAPAGGIGAIPAGMAGGAAAGAGYETARQALGKLVGLNQDISGKDIAISGAAGAVSPLLGGFGTKAGELAAKGIAPGVASFMERGAIPMAGSAIYGKAKGFASKIPEMVSGAKSEDAVRFLTRPGAMQTIASEGEQGIAKSLGNEAFNALSAERNAVGQEIQSKIRESGKSIDLTPIEEKIFNRISELKSKPMDKASIQQISDLENLYNDLFMRTNADGSTFYANAKNIDAADTFNMKDKLNEAANFFKFRDPKDGGMDNYLASIAADMKNKLNENINTAIEGSGEISKRYSDLSKAERVIRDKFGIGQNEVKQSEKSLSTIDNLYSRKNESLRDSLNNMGEAGEKILEAAKDVKAFRTFNEPSWTPISSGGTTSTSRTKITQAMGGALGAALGGNVAPSDNRGVGVGIGGAIGYGLGGFMSSPAMMKQLIRAGLGAERVGSTVARGSTYTGLPQAIRQQANKALVNSTWNKLQEKRQ